MQARAKKRRRRGRIVPAAVFAVGVAITTVPGVIGCGGADEEQQAQGVAVPPPPHDTSGGEGDVAPSVAARPDDLPMGVAAQPDPPMGVAAVPPSH